MSSLTEAHERTEAALAAERELVANVSHELRPPLALIGGYVETLERTADSEPPAQWREYLAIVERETENLSRLVDDLFYALDRRSQRFTPDIRAGCSR